MPLPPASIKRAPGIPYKGFPYTELEDMTGEEGGRKHNRMGRKELTDRKGYKLVEEGTLRLFIVLTLFFPAFYSFLSYEEGGEYFAGFSVAYAVLAIFLMIEVLAGRKESDTKFFWTLLGGLVVYNILSFYYNGRYLHWYGEQVNNTIAILLFAVLIRYGGFSGEQGKIASTA